MTEAAQQIFDRLNDDDSVKLYNYVDLDVPGTFDGDIPSGIQAQWPSLSLEARIVAYLVSEHYLDGRLYREQ